MDASEQPTAPYLDAVVAYAFRGPGALPRARPQGRARAPIPGCARRSASTGWPPTCRRTSTGSTSGPSPTPYERAEQLAAEAFGAERTFFLTNGATQGNHTLCLALAPLGTRIVAQRNSHASIVDGLVLSGGLPSFVAPGVRRRARDHALRHARGARGGAARGARRARRVHRLADLLRHGRRRRRLRGGRARAPASRSSSTRRGARTSASTRRCRRPRSRRAPTRCSRARTRSPAR